MRVSSIDFAEAISAFGAATKKKLANKAVSGAPEDQLRAPLEALVTNLAGLSGLPAKAVTLVGESTLAHLSTRPDYAVSVNNALVGFIEIKAPGKGADPRRFADEHDRRQWSKLKTLPNLLYTDGNGFSLWQNGELQGSVIRLDGDVETSGSALAAKPDLLALFSSFLSWQPIQPRSAKQLAQIAARLCRLLREEVAEELDRNNPGLTSLAKEWRTLLFPDASNEQFADGYAQAVTFGLLVARVRDIDLSKGLDEAANQLRRTSTLIGTALRLLIDNPDIKEALKTSLGTLSRVLNVVDWPTIAKGDAGAWLYFYEDFLEVYDNDLRKRTGSYYTPPEVVNAMVRLTDEALRSPDLFNRREGLAAPTVTICDPAVGTGTFLLGVLNRIAATVEEDQGPGAVPGAICSRGEPHLRLRAAVRAVRRGAAAPYRRDAGPDRQRQPQDRADAAALCDGHAGRSLRDGDTVFRTCQAHWRVTEAGEQDQARDTDHRRHRQSALQGEGQGPRRLDREGQRRAQGADGPLGTAGSVGRRRPRQASQEPLRVFLALGDTQGVRLGLGGGHWV